MQTHLLLVALLLLAGPGYEAGFVQAQQSSGSHRRQEVAASNPASPRTGGDDSPILASGEWAPATGNLKRGDLTGRFNRKWLTTRGGGAVQDAEDDGGEEGGSPEDNSTAPAELNSDSGSAALNGGQRQKSSETGSSLDPPIPEDADGSDAGDEEDDQPADGSGGDVGDEGANGVQDDTDGDASDHKDAKTGGFSAATGKTVKSSKHGANEASGNSAQDAVSKHAGSKQRPSNKQTAPAMKSSDHKHKGSKHEGSAHTDKNSHHSQPSMVPLHHRKNALLHKPARKHRHKGDGRRQASAQHSGKGTYYNPGQNRGACGGMDSSKDLVAAISHRQWSNGGYCGKSINVCHQGKCVDVRVVDE